MNAGSEISFMYREQQYYDRIATTTAAMAAAAVVVSTTPPQHTKPQQRQQVYKHNISLPSPSSLLANNDRQKSHYQYKPYFHSNQMISHSLDDENNNSRKPNNFQQNQPFSSPLSMTSSLSTSTASSASRGSLSPTSDNTLFSGVVNNTTNNTNNNAAIITYKQPLPLQQNNAKNPSWDFTWLVFMAGKWVPFDIINQTKLEQTLTVGGTFVDIVDSHFPDVKRVRAFPKTYYLSYLGVKYQLSRIMQPDAYLNHMNCVYEQDRNLPAEGLPLLTPPHCNNNNNNTLFATPPC